MTLALEVFKKYKELLIEGKSVCGLGLEGFQDERINEFKKSCNPLIQKIQIQTVEKNKVLENKDVVLSAERYFEKVVSLTKFELVKLSDVCEVIRGITFGKNDQLEFENDSTVKIATTKACQENGIVEKDLYNIPKRFVKDYKKYLKDGDILMSTANSLNLLLNFERGKGDFESI